MKFIGIDLGWISGSSGLCCLSWDNERLQLLDLNRQQQLDEIFTWVDTWISPTEHALIAVDAPTLIPNATGTRLPDKLTHKYFGRYHAGCYPANLKRPFAQRTVEFGLSLEKRGFTHAPVINLQQPGRYQIEVFPHPAIVHLFGLKRILKYKKGKLAERQAELIMLHQYILTVLPNLEPCLNFETIGKKYSLLLTPHSLPLTCFTLKAVEDQLDSLICAYIGAHWWYWGKKRNWVLGDATTGYIVVPAPQASETSYPSAKPVS